MSSLQSFHPRPPFNGTPREVQGSGSEFVGSGSRVNLRRSAKGLFSNVNSKACRRFSHVGPRERESALVTDHSQHGHNVSLSTPEYKKKLNYSCRRWRSNPSGKCSQERLTRGLVTSTMRRAAHPSGCARCGAGASFSAIKHQSLSITRDRSPER